MDEDVDRSRSTGAHESAESYESAESHESVGDAVCWIGQLCPECGAMPEGAGAQDPDVPCWRCGTIRSQARGEDGSSDGGSSDGGSSDGGPLDGTASDGA